MSASSLQQNNPAGAILEIIEESLLELPDGFNSGSDLFEQGLDSMGIMHIILVIEEQFGVQLSPSDISREHFSTADSIANLIHERQKA